MSNIDRSYSPLRAWAWRWLSGWLCLLDGLVQVLTLGFLDLSVAWAWAADRWLSYKEIGRG